MSTNIPKNPQPFISKKIKNVLIALDYNASAQKVAEMGYSLAKSMNARVTLLHVVADATYYSTLEYSPILGFSGFNSAEFLQMVNVEGLKKASLYFLEQTKNHLADNSIQIRIEEGDLAETILETAMELNSNIIVMGSHSRRWLEKILIGSVAEKVLHHTSIPLFIVPIKEETAEE